MLQYSEAQLREALSRLSPAGRAAFAASCAERLLPAYRSFHERSGLGDSIALERALSALWAHIEGTLGSDLAIYARSADALVPGEEDAWSPEMPAAQNAAAAVAYAIRCHMSANIQDAAWAARQVYEALDSWVVIRDDLDLNVEGRERRIIGDPLIQAELARQRRDVEELTGLSDEQVRSLIPAIQARARDESSRVFHAAEP